MTTPLVFLNFPSPAIRKSIRGFSLLELMVTIGVLAALCAMLIPAVKKGIETGNETKCLSNLRQIGLAAENYTQESSNRFPDIDAWVLQLSPYLLESKNIQTLPKYTKTVYWCPSAVRSEVDSSYNSNCTYGINAQWYAGLHRFQSTANGNQAVASRRIAFMDSKGKNIFDTTAARVPSWHGLGYNVVFADLHVEHVRYVPESKEWRNLFWGYERY